MRQARREFLKQVGGGLSSMAAVGAVQGGPATLRSGLFSSEGISVGLIGCKGMGFSNLRSLLRISNVRCAALCDVDRNVLSERFEQIRDRSASAPARYGDYRRLLENPSVDVVVIGTPDHWHCRMMVDALKAGKHVYVEKPLANSIQECDIMLGASADHPDQVVQVGQWQRSGPHWRDAIDFVHSGKLGKIRTVKTWAYQGWMKPVPVLPDEPVPEGVDYDMWLGPAAERPFNRNRFHFNFRWFWDYAGGLMTDWGVHIIDFALYGMRADYPKSVMASGGKFAYPDDASETPDTLQAIYEFDDFTMIWEHATGIDLGPYQRTHGVAFIGNAGTLVVDRRGWEVLAEKENDPVSKEPVPKLKVPSGGIREGSDLDRHTENFVAAIRNGSPVNAAVPVAHKTAVVAHMGNVAFKTGRKIHWDKSNGRFRNDEQANRISEVSYRAPWELPG